jgi:hypothetical protein
MTGFSRLRRVASVILVLVGSSISPTSASAQVPSAPNRLFLELWGNGLIYSFNYERETSGPLTLRVGAGGLPFESVEYALGFGMLGVRKVFGVHSLRASAGVGVLGNIDVWVTEATGETHFFGTGAIGYQYQPKPGGFFVRASFTPGVTENEVFPWGGIGFGWAF